MAEIQVDVEKLRSYITELSKVESSAEAVSSEEISVKGGGNSITKIHELDETVLELRSSMIKLMTASVSYFTNVANSMEEADEEAAAGIGGE